MRLPPQPGERLDRGATVSFSFEDTPVEAFAGDTIGSALFAAGQRVFSRSFKYHRPRGLLCCSGACANCLMTVDGVPNVRVCVEPARPGARVSAQNVVGSLDFDLLGAVDRVGGPFTPVGFYYRTMIRPRRAWPYYERFLRSVAGLGTIDRHGRRGTRWDTEHRRVETLVVGAGRSGLAAARDAAARGEQVVVVDEGPPRGEPGGVGLLAPARALGIWEGNLVPVEAASVLVRFRAGRIVVAAGGVEQPLVFPGNDLVGVMLPGAVRRLVHDFSLRPGERAVVVSAGNGEAVAGDLRAAGVDVVRVSALPRSLGAVGRRGRLRSVALDGERIDCDLLVADGGLQPAYSLLAQAGARVEYEPARGVFVPRDLPAGVEAVGRAAGELPVTTVPAPRYDGAS